MRKGGVSLDIYITDWNLLVSGCCELSHEFLWEVKNKLKGHVTCNLQFMAAYPEERSIKSVDFDSVYRPLVPILVPIMPYCIYLGRSRSLINILFALRYDWLSGVRAGNSDRGISSAWLEMCAKAIVRVEKRALCLYVSRINGLRPNEHTM